LRDDHTLCVPRATDGAASVRVSGWDEQRLNAPARLKYEGRQDSGGVFQQWNVVGPGDALICYVGAGKADACPLMEHAPFGLDIDQGG
jgi:hypothetical protein